MFYSPLLSKLRRLGKHVTASDVATRSWTVEPAEEADCPGAIFLADEVERVTGYSAHSTREQELARIVPHSAFRPATVVSEIHGAVLCGSLYAGPLKYRIADRRELVRRIPHERADGGVLCSTWLGALYFGHWLAEDTPRKLLADPFGAPSEIDRPRTEHQRRYDMNLGIRSDPVPDFCHFDKIKLIDAWLFSRFLARGWGRITDSIEALYPGPPHIGCMLLRGTTGSRRVLLNEGEIADKLRSLGFRIVDPAVDSLDTILDAARGSRIVVGVEGSQMAHGFHCLRAGGALVVLQPPNRFGCIDKMRCDLKDARYAFTVGHADTDGFRIDVDRLMRLLDRVVETIRPVSPVGLP